MNKKLFVEAISKYVLGLILVGLLLFIPGGIHYFNGWLFMGLLFIPMFIGGIVLMIKNPKLLKMRLDAKEKEKEQKEVLLFSTIMFIVGFIISGLNYRYSWYILNSIIVIISSVVFLISYLLYAVVLKQNSYLSRTIGVKKNQKLVDTGMYKVVRHPMYMITVLLFLTMPLVLGSIQAFIVFLIYPFIIVKRINNEEKVLEKELKGYKAYQNKVKYKLIPFIW